MATAEHPDPTVPYTYRSQRALTDLKRFMSRAIERATDPLPDPPETTVCIAREGGKADIEGFRGLTGIVSAVRYVRRQTPEPEAVVMLIPTLAYNVDRQEVEGGVLLAYGEAPGGWRIVRAYEVEIRGGEARVDLDHELLGFPEPFEFPPFPVYPLLMSNAEFPQLFPEITPH